MSIQPELTPAQQAVRDAIQAWRDESGISLPEADWCRIGVLKTAPEQCVNTAEGLVQSEAAKPHGRTWIT